MGDLKPIPPAGGQLRLTKADFDQVLKKPLRMLPEEVGEAVLRVWVCNSHMKGFETPLALAGLMRVWMDTHGLRPDDAADMLDRMLAPGNVGQVRYVSDLTAALGVEVERTLVRRRQEKEQDDRRKADQAGAAAALPPGEVARLLKGIGRSPVE